MFGFDNRIFHNAFDAKYRDPLGAVAAGEPVMLRIYCDNPELQGVTLRIYGEDYREEYPLGCSDNWWGTLIETPEKPGVYWYSFAIYSERANFFYGAKYTHGLGMGEMYTMKPLGFQMTVHLQDFKTPGWCKKTIMYQIFPDRFARSRVNESAIAYHEEMGRKIYVHHNFSDMPLYLPMPGEQYYVPNDFFCGDLGGIEQNLSYLASLGVGAIYLNPIFESDSNHRYNTADYKKIDPILGTNEDFMRLCETAEKFDIKIIIDGVFSHTGADSVYFNMNGNYPEIGAYQSQDSSYSDWYEFLEFPTRYKSWWGFESLPEVDERVQSWQNFIIDSPNSVINTWLKNGASGYRLDVADELPDDIIEKMRTVIKENNSDNFLLGEVWEDATTKQSYGTNRKYALGSALDSVMNYPLRSAVLDFLCNRTDAQTLCDLILSQMNNYPKQMYYCLMNLLSSHDVERARTVLAISGNQRVLSREQQASLVVPISEDRRAMALQKLAVSIVYSLPGMPSIYYGDETGMHGLKDPFNRAPFCACDELTTAFYRSIGKIRVGVDALKTGYCTVFDCGSDILGILRFCGATDAFGEISEPGAYITLINRSETPRSVTIDLYSHNLGLPREAIRTLNENNFERATCQLTGDFAWVMSGLFEVTLSPLGAGLFKLT